MGRIGFVAGVAVGLSGPLFMVAVGGFGIAAGPSLGGLVFLVAVLALIVSGFGAGRSEGWVPTFVVSGALSLGIVAGAFARPLLVIGETERPAAPQPVPHGTPYIPPVFLDAHGDVALHLDDGPALTSGAPRLEDSHRFGHWCQSRGDSRDLGSVEAMDVGQLGGNVLWASVDLDVGPVLASSVPTPWVVIEASRPDRSLLALWRGQGRSVSDEVSAGRIEFELLQLEVLEPDDPSTSTWPTTLSGALTWTCSAWSDPS